MNEHYQNFDEMTRGDLVTHLVNVEGRDPEIAEDTVENMRECAWVCYAGHCGLEFFRDELMQFGDGGYPYLYLSPADGGDGLCHSCATKEFKRGASVAWSHHMEGEDEHCADCGAVIRPFVKPGPKSESELEYEQEPFGLGVRPGMGVVPLKGGPFDLQKPGQEVKMGVDWSDGRDFHGVTLVMDGRVLGTVTEVTMSPPQSSQTVRFEGFDVYAVPLKSGGALRLGATKVNWPLLAKAIEDQSGDSLSEKERAWVEEMKALPNEFEDDETVECRFCHEQVPAKTAHLHQGTWVGDECCWDSRLRSTE